MHTRGEIQIAVARDDVERALAFLRARFSYLGLDPALAGLGFVYEDDYLAVVRDPVRFSSGFVGTYLRVVDRLSFDGRLKGHAAVVLPVREDAIWLRKMFRHSTRSWELECPRGVKLGAPTAEAAARAELDEEIGLPAESLISVGEVCSDTGITSNCVSTFFATLASGDPNPKPEIAEALGEIVKVPIPQLAEFLSAGRVRDSFTLSALQLSWARGLLRL